MTYQNLHTTNSAQDVTLAHYMYRVFSYMALGVGLTASLGFFASSIPFLRDLLLTNLLVSLGGCIGIFYIVWTMPKKIVTQSATAVQARFWLMSALMGIAVGQTFLYFNHGIILQAFITTSAGFAGLALFGFITKKDLSPLQSFLVMGIFGLLALGFIMMFSKSAVLYKTYNVLSIVIFSGLVAVDVQQIKYTFFALPDQGEIREKMAIYGAMSLYIDFINLFLSVIRLMGNGRRD